MRITVVGLGYVGLSNAVLLAQNNQVVALDISKERVDQVNERRSPIIDKEISEYLENKNLQLIATMNSAKAYAESEVIFICTPTNYDEKRNSFDTSSIENCLDDIVKYNATSIVVIKSTIPIGYTDELRAKYGKEDIIFSPEFLREGKALFDNLYPSRIIVGSQTEKGQIVANLLKEGAKLENIPLLLVNSREAEAIKLFANTYLAMRVAYFNELDSYAEANHLSSEQIVKGISFDPRIGDFYNNPSFGYGGYCLPKDTKQLLFNYRGTPNQLIEAIVKSNQTRKEFIVSQILKRNPKKVGIYRLIMKKDSDNFRSSAVWDIMRLLLEAKVEICVYEPSIEKEIFEGYFIENDFIEFSTSCDIIIANRLNQELFSVKEKVYTRDIFSRD